jgi:hypothetical protein
MDEAQAALTRSSIEKASNDSKPAQLGVAAAVPIDAVEAA